MKDLPVRTLIAVLLIGLLCLVAWFGGWVQAAVLGLFTVAAVYEMFTIFVKEEFAPPCFRKFCSAAQCSP